MTEEEPERVVLSWTEGDRTYIKSASMQTVSLYNDAWQQPVGPTSLCIDSQAYSLAGAYAARDCCRQLGQSTDELRLEGNVMAIEGMLEAMSEGFLIGCTTLTVLSADVTNGLPWHTFNAHLLRDIVHKRPELVRIVVNGDTTLLPLGELGGMGVTVEHDTQKRVLTTAPGKAAITT